MKAILYHQYGSPDVLRLEEVAKPAAQEGQVLVKIQAAAVAAGDWHLLRGQPWMARLAFGLFKPKYKILGADVAGTVEAVGSNVKHFQPGDEVFGDLSNVGFGGFAEYVVAPESALAYKPTNLTFAEAAAVPVSAITALQALRDYGQLQPGQQVLINGASGGVGTFAVQIAKAFGGEVTAVCSTGKVEMVRALGADHVIDYTKEDFTQSGERYDLIVAANGYRSLADYGRALKPQGRYVMVGGSNAQMFEAILLGPLRSKKGGQSFSFLTAKSTQQDMVALKEMIEAGQVKPVIDRTFPLAGVPDAIRYVEAGHARGKVIIAMESLS